MAHFALNAMVGLARLLPRLVDRMGARRIEVSLHSLSTQTGLSKPAVQAAKLIRHWLRRRAKKP